MEVGGGRADFPPPPPRCGACRVVPAQRSGGSPRVLALPLLSGGSVEQHCSQPRFQPPPAKTLELSTSSTTYGLCDLGLIISPLCSSCCCSVAQSHPSLKDCSPLDPLSLGFPRQEYLSGLPFPSPGDLPDPGIELESPAWQVASLPSQQPGKPSFPVT